MKHLLTISLLLLTTFTFAGEWTSEFFKGDPMTNDGFSYTAYTYNDGMGHRFTYWDKYLDRYRLTSEHIFNYDGYGQVFVKVGLYDIDMNLLELLNMPLYVLDGHHNKLEPYISHGLMRVIGQKKNLEKLFAHLLNRTGYVRFVAPVYNHSDFDIYVPCIKNEPAPSQDADSIQ